MKNALPLFILFTVLNPGVQAQTDKKPSEEKTHTDKMFHSLGTTVYLDIYNGPIREKKITETDPFGNTTTRYDYVRVSGISYFTLIYHFRYNVREMSDNAAFGVSALPSLGIFAGGSSPNNSISVIPANFSGCFNLPLMAGMHFGASATNKSKYPIGFFAGAGYEFNSAPMVYAKTVKNRDIQTKWFNPCVSVGFKYESSSNFGSLQEVNLKLGFGLLSTDINEPNNLSDRPFVFTKSLTFRISYFTYLNY